jgi:hypothetical protein
VASVRPACWPIWGTKCQPLIVGPLVALALLGAGFGDDVVWRTLLAFGAVPAAPVIYLRRKMPESPRYQLLTAAVSLLGLALTRVLPEPAGRSLEGIAAKHTRGGCAAAAGRPSTDALRNLTAPQLRLLPDERPSLLRQCLARLTAAAQREHAPEGHNLIRRFEATQDLLALSIGRTNPDSP